MTATAETAPRKAVTRDLVVRVTLLDDSADGWPVDGDFEAVGRRIEDALTPRYGAQPPCAVSVAVVAITEPTEAVA